MKTIKWIGCTVIAGMLAGGAGVTRAADNAVPARANPARLMERAKERLGLSDDQVAQIKSRLAEEKGSLKDILSRLHDARLNLRQSIRAEDASEISVRSASAKLAAVEAELAVERLKLHGKISPILTVDQRAKLHEMEGRIDRVIDRVIARAGERSAQ